MHTVLQNNKNNGNNTDLITTIDNNNSHSLSEKQFWNVKLKS